MSRSLPVMRGRPPRAGPAGRAGASVPSSCAPRPLRRDEDDVAATPSDHRGDGGLDNQERAREVDPRVNAGSIIASRPGLCVASAWGSSVRGWFFFSIRRRHTGSLCDWSSDVCSSDLQTITVNTNGTFTVRVTDGNSCQSLASAPVTVTVNPLPVAVITPSGVTTFCQGGSVTLDAGGGFSSYLWSNGDNTQTITVNTNGTLTRKGAV